MKGSRRNFHNLDEPKVMIIPMIDIMLFLLVFFMMATMYMVNTNTVQVNLPQAATAKMETKPNIVSITVTEDGKILFGEETEPVANLAASCREALEHDTDTAFVVRGDKKADYENVVAVFDALKSVGARRVSLATTNPLRPEGGR